MDSVFKLDLDALPALSPRAIELLALRIEDDDSEQRLRRIVAGEPQLAARIVGLANSVAYGLGNVRFSTLPLALRRIGLRRALQLSLAMLFGHPVGARLAPQLREDLWLHALAIATSAAEIARLKQHPEPAEAYLAGLLHDLGYMLAELASPGSLSQVQTLAEETGTSIEAAEHQIFGMDHAGLTAHLLAHWQVPEALADVLRTHHRVDCEPDSLPAILYCAEKLARLDVLGAALFGERAPPVGGVGLPRDLVELEFRRHLALDPAELGRVAERITGQVAGLAGFARVMAT